MRNWILRRFPIFSLVILALGMAWIYVSIPPSGVVTGGKIPAPREGFSAPDFTLQAIQGESIQLTQLRGKVVVLNLWATWCPPCQAEMPALQNVYQKYMDKPVVILAANMTHQDDLSRVLSFATERNLSLPILLDPSGELSNKYALRALPTTFFIDHQGTIRKVVAGGPIPEALLSSQIDRLLEERR